MSYNGYNQYSPYWQQTAGQSTTQSAGQNVTQTRSSYQPLSAYQHTQQPGQPSISQPAENPSSTSYGTEGYGNVAVNGAGNGRPQASPTSYASANDRASLDGATALGNLAYASSLGRGGSAQQLAHYDRHQSNSNYGSGSPYAVNSTPQIQTRTDDEQRKGSSSSRKDTNSRAQQATASPSFGYSSNNAAYRGPSPGNSTQTQSPYSQPRSAFDQHIVNQYSQQPRPINGQAIHLLSSRPESQAGSPPVVPVTQSLANQSQGRKVGGSIRETTQTRVPTPQQSTYQPSPSQTPIPSVEHAQRPQAQQGPRETGTNYKANSAPKSKAAPYLSSKENAAKRVTDAHQSPTVDTNRQASKPVTPVEPQYTTVDPSQVFNHVEYSRRQAAAAAEVAATKKAAEETEAARIVTTQEKSPQVNGTSIVASVPSVESDSATKDQIELEMKQMIEKMRDYKSKNPSLFTQIWEQVKKVSDNHPSPYSCDPQH